jgi:hypothetical protein
MLEASTTRVMAASAIPKSRRSSRVMNVSSIIRGGAPSRITPRLRANAKRAASEAARVVPKRGDKAA